MSGITVRSTAGKLQKDSAAEKDLRETAFITGQYIGSNRRALDIIPIGFYLLGEDLVVEAGSNDNLVNLTAHGAKRGDILRIQTSVNPINEFEIHIDEIVDADSFRLSCILSASLTAGDLISILRPVSQRFTADGACLTTLESAPVSFLLDGVATEVVEDTAVPGNNTPLPVKLVGVTGDINITAGDLNVQLNDMGVNGDKTRIGDGSGNYLGINASTEALVHDTDALAKLEAIRVIEAAIQTAVDAINGKLATLGQKAMVGSVPVVISSDQASFPVTVSGVATEAKQDTQITSLASLLTELQLKADLSETQPVSAASLPLPSGAATSAKQDLLLAELQLKADLTETQPVSLASVPLPTGASTAANQASEITELQGVNTKLTSTNTKLDSLETAITPEFSNHETQTVAGSVVTFTMPANARRMVIQNSLEADSPMRFAPAAATPSSTNGFYLGIGQSTSEMAAGSFKAISTDGGNANVTVIWSV